MAIYGYARIHAGGQGLAEQIAALKEAGAVRVFCDKGARGTKDRSALHDAIKSLAENDTLLVLRLDCLARSTLDLQNLLGKIVSTSARFRSLSDPWIDTTSPHAALVLSVIASIADFERNILLTHRAGARARGIHMGRPRALNSLERAEAIKCLTERSKTQVELARRFNVDRSTISRLQRG